MSLVATQQERIDDGSRGRPRGLVSVLRRRPSAAVGCLILVTFAVLALAAPVLAPSGLEQVGAPFAPPSREHWLGLDDGGVDMVSLLMWGARVSLLVGFAAAAISLLIGGTIGICAGYFGGRTDTVAMRTTDYFLVIPDVPLMIVVAALWGSSLTNIVLIIGLLLWTWTARVIRAQTKSLRERTSVRRARSQGASHFRIMSTHVLPHLAPLLVANAVLTISVAIFNETALSFLGLGDPTMVSWGKILRSASERTALSNGAWWAVIPPGVCIALVIVSCQMIGQSLEESLNPKLALSHLAPRFVRRRDVRKDAQ
jgi:peptide/nickel transport system permease protein